MAGAGNVMMVAGLRPIAKAMDQPPEPKVRAPVLDPTCGNRRRVTAFDDPVMEAATRLSKYSKFKCILISRLMDSSRLNNRLELIENRC